MSDQANHSSPASAASRALDRLQKPAAAGDADGAIGSTVRDLLGMPLIGGIRIYQWSISPLLGPHCRHLPTCSQYAIEAIQRYGPIRGSWLALRRLLRCHPWGTSGYDPVPPTCRPSAQRQRRSRLLRQRRCWRGSSTG